MAATESVNTLRKESSRDISAAVDRHSRTSVSGVFDSLFSKWFSGLVYSMIWEDPEVDRIALEIKPDHHIVSISSAGCNAISYLVDSPAKITSVDLNVHHLNLTKLKIAAVKSLPSYEDLFQFLVIGKGEKNLTLYRTYVEPALDPETRMYWNSGLLGPRASIVKNGIYEKSRSGFFLGFLKFLAKLSGCDLEKVLQAKTGQEQVTLYNQNIAPAFNNIIVKTLAKIPASVFSLGIPPHQYDSMVKEGKGNVVKVFEEKARHLVCDFPIEDNYFAWQALGRKYNAGRQSALPLYLQREHYERVKANAGRIRTVRASMTDELANHPDSSVDRFVLLDAQDWMEEPTLKLIWTQIKRTLKPNGRIIFRSAPKECHVIKFLENEPEFKNDFWYNKTLSEKLLPMDRSAIYGGFHVVECRN